jgi:hypothetical protein
VIEYKQSPAEVLRLFGDALDRRAIRFHPDDGKWCPAFLVHLITTHPALQTLLPALCQTSHFLSTRQLTPSQLVMGPVHRRWAAFAPRTEIDRSSDEWLLAAIRLLWFFGIQLKDLEPLRPPKLVQWQAAQLATYYEPRMPRLAFQDPLPPPLAAPADYVDRLRSCIRAQAPVETTAWSRSLLLPAIWNMQEPPAGQVDPRRVLMPLYAIARRVAAINPSTLPASLRTDPTDAVVDQETLVLGAVLRLGQLPVDFVFTDEEQRLRTELMECYESMLEQSIDPLVPRIQFV